MQSICSVFLGLQSMTQIQYSYFHLWHCIGTHEISDVFYIMDDQTKKFRYVLFIHNHIIYFFVVWRNEN